MNEIDIIEYRPELQPFFEKISRGWIESHFSLEPFDIKQLQHPQENILDKGGAILFAKEGESVLGTVGLLKAGEDEFEMVKMGVVPEAQGKKIGWILGKAVLEKARGLGAKRVVLYSNSKLEAALGLYRKLGFKEMPVGCSSYGRCDVKMEI